MHCHCLRKREETDKLIWSPDYQLKLIAENVKQLVTQQTAILYEHIEPALSEANIRILRRFDDLGARERERLRTFFTEELELNEFPVDTQELSMLIAFACAKGGVTSVALTWAGQQRESGPSVSLENFDFINGKPRQDLWNESTPVFQQRVAFSK